MCIVSQNRAKSEIFSIDKVDGLFYTLVTISIDGTREAIMAVPQNRISLEKVLVALYDRIIAREITQISQVVDQTKSIPLDAQQRETMMQKAFFLIKTLNWGVFADLNVREYTVLWHELVLSHPSYKFAGDLKRSMTISNVFISMLDIHGYTAFCRQSKNNLSQLHELDNFLNTTIRDVAKNNGCIGNRERGDEIVLVGGRASDILKATFEIIQIFARENFFKQSTNADPSDKYNRILPAFNISAGISGGNTNSPMIITRKGEISGFLLNTAARLQTRANKLAPKHTKIIIAKTVHTYLEKENRLQDFMKYIDFFDCGSIEFKGMSIANMEVLFREADKKKLKYQKVFLEMLSSLRQNLWKDRVMLDCLSTMDAVITILPPMRMEVALPGYKTLAISNDLLHRKITIIQNSFSIQDDYITAIIKFDELMVILQQVPDFEPIVLEYGQEINDRYKMILTHYEPELEREIEQKKGMIFSPQELRVYDYFKSNANSLELLAEKARKSPQLSQRKILWNSMIEKKKSELDFSLYSGKK